MEVRLTPSPVPKAKVTPKTVVISRLLTLPAAELEPVILQELSENPALELVDAGYCQHCGASFSGSVCPYCGVRALEGEAAMPTPDWGTTYRAYSGDEEDWDPLAKVAAPRSIEDHLLWQLSPQLSASELEIASLLLEHLDDHGFLGCEPELVASSLGVSPADVLSVLAELQRQDPVGLGARTAQECLLIQLECLGGDEEVVSLSRQIIEEHWEALGKGKLERIAEELQVEVQDVECARDFIRVNLDPYPAHACLQGPASSEAPVEANYPRPDVIIRVRDSATEPGFEIEFPQERRFRLGVHTAYRDLLETLDGDGTGSNLEEYEHVRNFVARTRLFISGWQERWRTLRKVVEALVAYQSEFLLKDERWLQPLTRAQLADTVGVHESTVSRAIASKYAEIPGGRIVALADFFDGSLKAKYVIKELVSQESHPLTDGDLVELLAKEGIAVARRTVAKYRQALGILPSELR